MKTKWMFAVLLAMTLLGSAAFAQDRDDNDRWRGDRDQRHDHDNDRDRDRDHDRDDRHDNGRHNGWRNRGDGDHDRDDRGGGWYGNGGDYGRNRVGGYNDYAYSTGFNDGLSIGRRDRASGHSFRPTNGAAYGDADHGYTAFGRIYRSRDEYQRRYRTGYLEGYRQGYGNSGYYGR